MRRLLLLSAILSTTLLAQGPGPRRAFAAGEGGGPGVRQARQANLTALKEYLGLTDAQVTAIREARKKAAEPDKAVLEQMRAKAQALRTEMQKDSPDAAAVGQLHVDLKKLRDEARGTRNGVDANVVAVLTPEQKSKLKALEEARKLARVAAQADALGLIAAPEPVDGAFEGRPGMRPMGPRMRPGMRGQMGRGPMAGPMGGPGQMRGPGPGPAAWMEQESGQAPPPPPAEPGVEEREF